MSMRRLAILAGLLFCAWPFLSFGSALAASPLPAWRAADDMNFTLEGKITEKTGNKLTVSSGENMIFHVVFNDQTQITKKDGSAGTAQDLHTGVNISVAGDLAESGEITAKKITIDPNDSEKK
jgi:Domain of unknown function (DUF5666)